MQAYRVKKGTSKKVYGEVVPMPEGTADTEFMQCNWRDGMIRDIVQLTFAQWTTSHQKPMASRAALRPLARGARTTTSPIASRMLYLMVRGSWFASSGTDRSARVISI